MSGQFMIIHNNYHLVDNFYKKTTIYTNRHYIEIVYMRETTSKLKELKVFKKFISIRALRAMKVKII